MDSSVSVCLYGWWYIHMYMHYYNRDWWPVSADRWKGWLGTLFIKAGNANIYKHHPLREKPSNNNSLVRIKKKSYNSFEWGVGKESFCFIFFHRLKSFLRRKDYFSCMLQSYIYCDFYLWSVEEWIKIRRKHQKNSSLVIGFVYMWNLSRTFFKTPYHLTH